MQISPPSSRRRPRSAFAAPFFSATIVGSLLVACNLRAADRPPPAKPKISVPGSTQKHGQPNTDSVALDRARALAERVSALEETGHYLEARPLAEEALALREKHLGPEHLDTAASVQELAEVFDNLGEATRAEELSRRALSIREKSLGPDHPDVAMCLRLLADLRGNAGDYPAARAFATRALAIREKALGPQAASVAQCLQLLANLDVATGDYAHAEPLFQRALEVHRAALGPDAPDALVTLNNFATLYVKIGNLSRAEPLMREALAGLERTLGPEHARTLSSANNLAVIRVKLGDPAGAVELFRRVVAAREKTLGPEHRDTVVALDNLAAALRRSGQLAEATPYVVRALEIRQKQLDPVYLDIAYSANNLGDLRTRQNDLAGAEAPLARALAIREKILGPEHPDTAESLRRLALNFLARGKSAEAAPLVARAVRADQAALAGVLAFTSEAQRLEFQAAADPYSLPARLGDPALLAETVLRHKGVVLDSLLEDRLVAEASADPAKRARFEEGRALRAEFIKRQLDAPADGGNAAALTERATALRDLAARVEALEGAMAREVLGLGRARRALSVTPLQVQAALPADGTLVEFLRYREDDPVLGKAISRYGALVLLPPSGKTTAIEKAHPSLIWVPLGPAAPIEAALREHALAVRERGDALKLEESLGTLYRLVWEPVARALPADATTVVVSPDGALNFLSFATLLAPDEKFLGERLRFSYASSGRDLLPPAADAAAVAPLVPDKPGGTLVVFANPNLGNFPDAAGTSDEAKATRAAAAPAELRDLRALRFPPLPGAEAEGVALVRRAKDQGWRCELFTAATASEKQLRAVRSPRVLHLATHAFFLASADPAAPQSRGGEGGSNPMRRAGLVLAGAGDTLRAWAGERQTAAPLPSSENDGIVTAEEISTLDLRDTWLVALSACESGVGEARSGEGVLGLRRGFARAGARNLLMTLWPVPDRETAALMLDFYAAAEKTGDPARALAETQRAHMTRLRREQGLAAAVRSAGAFILSSQGR